jgi:hypothetical protein
MDVEDIDYDVEDNVSIPIEIEVGKTYIKIKVKDKAIMEKLTEFINTLFEDARGYMGVFEYGIVITDEKGSITPEEDKNGNNKHHDLGGMYR